MRAQAAHYIDSTLSRSLLVKHLKNDLAQMMEKGKVYQPRGTKSQLTLPMGTGLPGCAVWRVFRANVDGSYVCRHPSLIFWGTVERS